MADFKDGMHWTRAARRADYNSVTKKRRLSWRRSLQTRQRRGDPAPRAAGGGGGWSRERGTYDCCCGERREIWKHCWKKGLREEAIWLWR